jgi:hypothetical protein
LEVTSFRSLLFKEIVDCFHNLFGFFLHNIWLESFQMIHSALFSFQGTPPRLLRLAVLV